MTEGTTTITEKAYKQAIEKYKKDIERQKKAESDVYVQPSEFTVYLNGTGVLEGDIITNFSLDSVTLEF